MNSSMFPKVANLKLLRQFQIPWHGRESLVAVVISRIDVLIPTTQTHAEGTTDHAPRHQTQASDDRGTQPIGVAFHKHKGQDPKGAKEC